MRFEISFKHVVHMLVGYASRNSVSPGQAITIDLLKFPHVAEAAARILTHKFCEVHLNPPNPFEMAPQDILEILHRGLFNQFQSGELKVPIQLSVQVRIPLTLQANGNPYPVFNTGIPTAEAAHTQSIVNLMNQWTDSGKVLITDRGEAVTDAELTEKYGKITFVDLYKPNNIPYLKEY